MIRSHSKPGREMIVSSKLDKDAARKASITLAGLVTFGLALIKWPIIWTVLKVAGGVAITWFVLYGLFNNGFFEMEDK